MLLRKSAVSDERARKLVAFCSESGEKTGAGGGPRVEFGYHRKSGAAKRP